jgi:uncharacterized membrane protein
VHCNTSLEITEEVSLRTNVGRLERIGSIAAGAALVYFARRNARFAPLARKAGTGLIARGIAGYCPVNAALGRGKAANETRDALGGARGIHVLESVVVPSTPAEVYAFWRDFSNLPKVFSHLERVDVTDATHSHWVASAPAGLRVAWDAKVINDVENKLIGWKSLENADVVSAGSVRFRPSPGGTRVTVHLQYDPPGGRLGNWLAQAFGQSPAQLIRQELAQLHLHLPAGGSPYAIRPIPSQERRGSSSGRSSLSPHSFHEPV